ncbi:MAG: hypothetical protein PVF85_06785 [Anaerolineales bacterium]|jgi:hypothetical protein
MVEFGILGAIVNDLAPGSAFALGVFLGTVIFLTLKVVGAASRKGSARAQTLHIDLKKVRRDPGEAGKAAGFPGKTDQRAQGSPHVLSGRRWQFYEVSANERLGAD